MISVVIVTKGERPDDLNKCITALSKQTVEPFEVIIVLPQNPTGLDFSSDLDLLIRWVKQNGKGISNARNYGVKTANGEIIAFTDDDAEPYPDWVEKIGQYFEENSDLDYLGGEFTLQTDTVWQRWIDQSYHLSEIDIERGLCHGNNMAYRREVFDNHLFDENIIFGAEEVELQIRLHASGLKCMTFQDILIHHHHRNNFLSFTKMRWGYAQGHSYLYEVKYGQSLFHWDDLMNIGFFISMFYFLITLPITALFLGFPFILFCLIAIKKKRSYFTISTWMVEIYVSLFWTLAKMYHSFKYHLRRWELVYLETIK